LVSRPQGGTSGGMDGYPCNFHEIRGRIYCYEVLSFVLVLPMLLVLFSFPSLIGAMALNALNVYCTVVGILHSRAAHLSNGMGYQYFTAWITGARVFQCVLCGNAWLSCTLQVVHTAILVHTEMFTGRRSPTTIGLLCLVMGFSLAVEHATWTIARLVQKAKRLAHSSSLVSALLEGTNDAVVHLNKDLHITRPTAKLGALLMAARSEDGHQGTKFMDVVAEKDRERLEEQLRSVKPDGDFAVSAVTTSLRDVFGNSFSVELNWVFVPNEHECYVLGVREAGEGARLPPAVLSKASVPTSPTEVAPEQIPRGSADSSPSGSADSSQSASLEHTLGSEGSRMWAENSGETLVESKVEASAVLDADFGIINCSGGFFMLFGEKAAHQQDFRKLFYNSTEFEKCIKREISKAATSNEGTTHRLTFCDIFKTRKPDLCELEVEIAMPQARDRNDVSFALCVRSRKPCSFRRL